MAIDTLEEILRERLMTGSPSYAGRIYPLRMPSNNTSLVFPLMVYKRISAPRVYTQTELEAGTLVEPRVQYNIWAKKYEEMVVASQEIKARLSGWKDDSKGIMHCFIMFELDQWEEQTGLFKKMLDAQVGWKGY